MDRMVEVLGWKLTALMIGVAVLYFIVALAPVWWPAIRVFRSRPRLPRPVLFVAVVACLVYGVFFLLGFVVLLPLEAYRVFLLPELDPAGGTQGHWLTTSLDWVSDYGWIVVVIAELALTIQLTRTLAPRWAHLCSPPPPQTS